MLRSTGSGLGSGSLDQISIYSGMQCEERYYLSHFLRSGHSPPVCDFCLLDLENIELSQPFFLSLRDARLESIQARFQTVQGGQ